MLNTVHSFHKKIDYLLKAKMLTNLYHRVNIDRRELFIFLESPKIKHLSKAERVYHKENNHLYK